MNNFEPGWLIQKLIKRILGKRPDTGSAQAKLREHIPENTWNLNRPRTGVLWGTSCKRGVSGARVCFPDTSIKVSQMPCERHVACIELHNSNGQHLRSSEVGPPTSEGRQLLPT
jgi:hypothetical protein